MTEVLDTAHGPVRLPSFMPDATRGFVRTAAIQDLENCGLEILMVNVLHLSSHPGTSLVADMGGIHSYTGWRKAIASDSGGFQAYSLVAGNKKMGNISNDGFSYRLDKSQDRKLLTPEKCIQKQFQLGSDIMFCLDLCTHPAEAPSQQRLSVDYTVAWGKRCKEEFMRRSVALEPAARPLLFAVVQGGADPALRRECAERLLDIGFDGYGYGGWPIDDQGRLVDMVEYTAQLLPPEAPKHALGIGKAENVVRGFQAGYRLFDCVLPTRDARQKRLYVFNDNWEKNLRPAPLFYHYLYMQDQKHNKDESPIDASCDCACCRRHSRAYLYHLFQEGEPAAPRLATIHNLRFYTRLLRALEGGVGETRANAD